MTKLIKLLNRLNKKIPVSQKFKTDSILNILSFILIGINGLVLNTIIAKTYDSETLGLFSIGYALFILLAHFIGAGVHFSILKNTAQNSKDTKKAELILQSGLLATLLNSLLIAPIILLARNIFAPLFDNSSDVNILFLIAPGLIFFALNKSLLAFHNAHRHMKVFAVFNALRSILLLTFFLILYSFSISGKNIIVIFSIEEFILFAILAIYSRKHLSITFTKKTLDWMRKHLKHGYKSIMGSIFIDANTRIGVMVLGLFETDSVVGVFSFAYVFVDGFRQVANVFRTNVNPLLTQINYNKEKEELQKFIIKGRNYTYAFLIPLGILVMIGYPIILYILGLNQEYDGSILPLTILISSSIISIGYAPFLMIFNQTGSAGIQSVLYVSIFATNMVMNLILVPPLGMTGSAIATGISFISIAILVKILTLRTLKIKI